MASIPCDKVGLSVSLIAFPGCSGNTNLLYPNDNELSRTIKTAFANGPWLAVVQNQATRHNRMVTPIGHWFLYNRTP